MAVRKRLNTLVETLHRKVADTLGGDYQKLYDHAGYTAALSYSLCGVSIESTMIPFVGAGLAVGHYFSSRVRTRRLEHDSNLNVLTELASEKKETTPLVFSVFGLGSAVAGTYFLIDGALDGDMLKMRGGAFLGSLGVALGAHAAKKYFGQFNAEDILRRRLAEYESN